MPPPAAVDILYDLPPNAAFLEELCRELKPTCGGGGAMGDGAVERQGDQRDRLCDLLVKKGLEVNG